MPRQKKGASRKVREEEKEEPALKPKENRTSATKKAGSEIDDIFGGKKRKKPAAENPGNPKVGDKSTKQKPEKKKKRQIEADDEGRFLDGLSRGRKKTGEGLVIYTEEELGLNKGDAGGLGWQAFHCYSAIGSKPLSELRTSYRAGRVRKSGVA